MLILGIAILSISQPVLAVGGAAEVEPQTPSFHTQASEAHGSVGSTERTPTLDEPGESSAVAASLLATDAGEDNALTLHELVELHAS